MALPLLTEQRILAAKSETTYGTAEALTGAEAAMNIFDSEMIPQGDINARTGQSSLSRLTGAPGAVWNKTTFKSELYGGGSADPPAWAVLLQACGMAVGTATYTPQTGGAAATSVTLGSYRDGTLATSAGAMGNFTLKGESGKPAIFDWDFMGTYIVPTDVALLAPTYPTTIPPVFMAATLTIGGTAYIISDFELSPNNVVQMRPVGNSSSFGYVGAIIVNRHWTFKTAVEATLVATKNWYSTYTGGTTAALVLTLGSATHNIMSITAPVMQLNKPPQPKDKNGYIAHDLEFDLCRSAAAGDDEAQIVFS